MTAKEHAEIWHRAAEIVAGMDAIASEMKVHTQWLSSLPPEQRQQMGQSYMSRSFGPEEAAANRAYERAARVLSTIAAEYEKVSSQTED